MSSNQPTTIYIVRHGEVYNPRQILYGRMPRFGLSDLGREEAEVTASILANEPVAAIHSSPQLRARQTARVIAAYHPGLRVQTSRSIAEVMTGWQGRPYTELHAIDFDFYSNPLPGEYETVEHIWDRVRLFVERVRRRHEGETVVAVTHGDVAFVARAGYVGMPVEVTSIRGRNIYPGHASLTRLLFCAPQDTYPKRVEYFDPNSTGARWSREWVVVPAKGLLEASTAGEAGGPPWIPLNSDQ